MTKPPRLIPATLLASALLFSLRPARADCPDKPVSCALGAVGSQGTCWESKKLSCQSCGPRHCPTVPATVPKTYTYPCADVARADKVQVDGCSDPLSDKVDALYKTLLNPACIQHDLCYHNTIGIQKAACDSGFKDNATWICRTYYTGLANDAQLGACLAAVGTWYATLTAAPQAAAYWKSDHEWIAAHCPASSTNPGSRPAPGPATGPGPAQPRRSPSGQK